MTNEGEMVLLAGPASAVVGGQFVGHGEIPTVAAGENFTVGFAIDSSMRAARELVEKSETIQDGNRVADFTYQLAVESFGAELAGVRLLDRLPSAKENEVKVTLVSPGEELSTSPTYLQTERNKGVPRWEVKVPGQVVGREALGLDNQFRLEYDKQMTVAGLPVAGQQ